MGRGVHRAPLNNSAPLVGGGGGGEQGTWAAQKHSEAGYGRPVDRGVWTAKTVKRPRQQPAHPQYANYWAPLTRKRHTMPHSAQSQYTNYWAPRTRKRHQQEHRPQQPTELNDLTQHAKGRPGDCPGPRKGATTRRNVTQGGVPPPPPWTPPQRLSQTGLRLIKEFLRRLWRRLVQTPPPPQKEPGGYLLLSQCIPDSLLPQQGILCHTTTTTSAQLTESPHPCSGWRTVPVEYFRFSAASAAGLPLSNTTGCTTTAVRGTDGQRRSPFAHRSSCPPSP